MGDARISLSETGVRIVDLDVPKGDVAEFLRRIPEPEWASALIQAVEVGVFCLERARTAQDLDFVRRQVESLISTVQTAVTKIPGETEKALVAKIGAGDGQVLAPVQQLVTNVTSAANEKIQEVKNLLTRDLNPADENATLGKALRALRELLDPRRTDSVQGLIEAKIQEVTSESGTLAKAVRDVVAVAVEPLARSVDSLAKEVRGQDAAAEALAQTTAKGSTCQGSPNFPHRGSSKIPHPPG